MSFCQRIINQYSPQSIQLNVRASFRGGMKGRKKHQEEEENKLKTDSLILPCCLFISLCAQSLSRVWLCATPWTLACLAPLSMGFPGKNSGVGCHFLLWGSSQPRDQTHVSCVSCLMDSVGEGEGGKIWENGIETCKISCRKWFYFFLWFEMTSISFTFLISLPKTSSGILNRSARVGILALFLLLGKTFPFFHHWV